MNYISIKNQQRISLETIPELEYSDFLKLNLELTGDNEIRHCVNYFGYKFHNSLKLFCCVADDQEHNILVSSTIVNPTETLNSFAAKNLAFEKFEREIHENFGLKYSDHPWLKPVRYSFDRFDQSSEISNYPFYNIDSEELHEVGVGPVHAGIIEPGHFRFICNGEQILHLEIQLGFQHRGVEHLFLNKKKLIQRTVLAESIAGDSVIAHSTAFAYLWESLCDFKPSRDILFSRTLAQEIERIAIHTGDLSAICADIAYQLGNSVFGRLRTPIINYFQEWCGNRLSKGLIRVGNNQYPFNQHLAERITKILKDYEHDFIEMKKEMFKMASVLTRLEQTGTMHKEELLNIGTVGFAARMNDINRDIRQSHPYGLYAEINHEPIIKHHGDVYSRSQIRKLEILQSIGYIRDMIKNIPEIETEKQELKSPQPNSFVISLTEGWRGEICHAAITDDNGDLVLYKIKDASFQNWLALALAVRNNEISDFPICNKSFDLSYCGHDL
jgi:Ni,Fe-hydrogenase III large subunit